MWLDSFVLGLSGSRGGRHRGVWRFAESGTAKPAAVVEVTPTPSQTRSQWILSPVGTISAFEFISPVPYPFGAERTGWLMANFDAGRT